MSRLLFVFLLLSIPIALSSKSTIYFEWTPLAKEAYQKSIQLRLMEARSKLGQLQEQEPNNYIAYHIEDYIDFFTVFINENPEEFKKLERNKNQRLDKIKEGPSDSPWYLYLQADIRLHWALARLKFEEYGTAFFEVNKAFKLLSKNQNRFPDFKPNLKDLGILHAIVGTIPEGYQWTVEWLSALEGSIDQGRSELEQVIDYARNNEFIFEEETYALYAYLLLHLNHDDEAAWKVINQSNLKPGTNPMACFIMANIAMRTRQNDRAIELLQNRPQSRAFHPFPYLDFMLGVCKLQRLDSDADTYLQRYLDRFNGMNFIKEAHQRLAWHYLIHGNENEYTRHIQLAISQGNAITGSDQSAEREGKSGTLPDPNLLKARLLFDGGYLSNAQRILSQCSPHQFSTKSHQIEYLYRLGRIEHALNNYTAALNHYQQTIEQGSSQPEYYACRAALESGHIYEQRAQFPKATSYFEQCLSIKPQEHKTGLHQAAKAGLERVKGKGR
jgi:tetratricopeptide (TPR) repeat protein